MMMMVVRPRAIATAREAHKFSQADLAALIGRSQPYVSMIENKRRARCSYRVARDICERLDLDIDVVFAPADKADKAVAA